MIASDRPPYPGLRPFQRDESDLFFGRDDCVDAMIARLGTTRFLAVLGSSGTGKSSLVKTGLLSGLEMGLLAGSRWRFAEFRPGGDPLGNLAKGLLESENPAANQAKAPDAEIAGLKARFTGEGPRELIKWCREGHLAEGTNLLLLVDQFEELFRYRNSDEREDAQAFVALLLESRWPRGVASPQDAQLPIYVTITMRSEYLGACALMLGLAEAINAGAYLTPRMTREQCEEAIVGPALVCGVDIEDRLVTRLLNDMADFAPWEVQRESGDQLTRLARQADQLPLMQYALNQMWWRAKKAKEAKDKQQPDERIQLKLDDYLGSERELDTHGDKVYGLGRELDTRGEEVYAGLSEPFKATAETLFRAVTSGTTPANAQRRRTKYAELVEICGDGSSKAVAAVIAAFGLRECQFLTSDIAQTGDAPLPEHAMIDISHESLIRQWRRLSNWLVDEGQKAHEWQQLNEQANNYLAGHRTRLRRLRGLPMGDGLLSAWQLFSGRVKMPTTAWAGRYGIDIGKTKVLLKWSRLHLGLFIGGLLLLLIGLAVETVAARNAAATAEEARSAAEKATQDRMNASLQYLLEKTWRSILLDDLVLDSRVQTLPKDLRSELIRPFIRAYDGLIERDPTSSAYLERGEAYSMEGDLNAAISDLNQAIARDPTNSIAYVDRGFAYFKEQDYDQAIADYAEVIDFSLDRYDIIIPQDVLRTTRRSHYPRLPTPWRRI